MDQPQEIRYRAVKFWEFNNVFIERLAMNGGLEMSEKMQRIEEILWLRDKLRDLSKES